jgi:hypothetical protein
MLQRTHNGFERLALAPQFQCALPVVPERRIFPQLDDFGQPLLLGIEVKDTSAILQCGARCPAGVCR